MKDILFYIKKMHRFSGKRLYVILLGNGVMSLLEGFGILLLIPMLTVSGMIKIDHQSIPMARHLTFLNHIPYGLSLPFILGLFLFIVICQNVLQRLLTIKKVNIVQRFILFLRLEIYQDLLKSNWEFFLKKRKSDIINIVTTEMGRVSVGINLFLQFLMSITFTLIQFGLALWLSFKVTLFVLLCGAFLSLFSRHFIKKSRALGNQTYHLSKDYLAGVTEQLNGIKDIKSNRLEEFRFEWIQSITRKILNEQLEYIKLKTSSQSFYKIASAVIIVSFIYLSVHLFHSQTGQFMLIIVIFSRLWPRVTNIQSSMEQLSSNISAFRAIKQLQMDCKKAEEFDIFDQKEKASITLEEGIKCIDINYRYNKNNTHYAIRNINLNIPVNQMTAIVGPSGAGKSTLIDILMGLIYPDSGEIMLDDTPLTSNNILSLRQSISYVPQDPYLFNESIRENMSLVNPSATESQIWEALEFAAAADFVRKLPQGLETVIGDRGVRLSGGERQRLVLARAILRKPTILVLDEATSSLDSENETKIQEALERLNGKMTIIVIAHRLSTIRFADQVIVLNKGQIIQQGGFTQLARDKRGMFNHLLEKQMSYSQ